MKKIFILLISIMFFPAVVNAAGKASIIAPASAENGENVTMSVTVTGVAAWNLTLSGSGATPGCSAKFADVTLDAKNTNKTFSVTCKASKEGTINFVVTGDITSADGANSGVSLSKAVSIVKARPKDTDNNLKSLSIIGQAIEFDKDITTYEIEVDYKTNKLDINASAQSNKAKVEIDNPDYLEFGENIIKVNVISESGSVKTYTIKVNKVEPQSAECQPCPTPEPVTCEKESKAGYIATISTETVGILSLLGYLLYDKKFKK